MHILNIMAIILNILHILLKKLVAVNHSSIIQSESEIKYIIL